MSRIKFILLLICFIAISAGIACAAEPLAKHVVLISFDGLRPDAITALGREKASAFYKMIEEGASTLNARTDYDYTVTLPNHTCMVTGYPVLGAHGHQVTENSLVDKSVHDFAGRHVFSVFETLRQNQRRSVMLASKPKFNIYEHSFPMDSASISDYDDSKTLKAFDKLVQEGLPDFVFMHFSNPDHVGHEQGWDINPNSPYMKQVEILNEALQKIIQLIDSNNSLNDSTVIIVTTDHGGEGKGHGDNSNPLDYTIPFIIWGKAVARGEDLYKINSDRRTDPLKERINNDQSGQPIRNGDAANLAVSLLGLASIEGSTIGFDKPLKIKKD